MTAVRRGRRRKKKKTHDDRWDRVGCLGYMLRRDIFVRLIVREECQSLARCTLLVTTHQPPLWTLSTTGEIALWETSETWKERVAERTPLNSKGGGGLCLDLATGQNRRGQKFLSTHTQNHTDTHLPFIMYSNMGKPHPCETYCNRNTFESFLNQARYLTCQP